jgi:hypothetical protein
LVPFLAVLLAYVGEMRIDYFRLRVLEVHLTTSLNESYNLLNGKRFLDDKKVTLKLLVLSDTEWTSRVIPLFCMGNPFRG